MATNDLGRNLYTLTLTAWVVRKRKLVDDKSLVIAEALDYLLRRHATVR
jgi:hypothetical protein